MAAVEGVLPPTVLEIQPSTARKAWLVIVKVMLTISLSQTLSGSLSFTSTLVQELDNNPVLPAACHHWVFLGQT